MPKPDPIETILARLMPPAMSPAGLRDIEAMLDELSGATPVAAHAMPAPAVDLRRMRRILLGGLAASGVAAAAVIQFATDPVAPTWAWNESAVPAAGMVLVSESDRIESITDEGWQENADGSTMHALRLNVVEENSLLDEETGIVMTVSQPREEILLMPVSAF